MDLVFELAIGDFSKATPEFWQLNRIQGPEWCEHLVVTADATRPAGCAFLGAPLCGPAGNGCLYTNVFGSGESIGYPPGRAKLLVSIVQNVGHVPVDLPSGSYFAFGLGFHLPAIDPDTYTCDGCSTPVEIVWSQAFLYNPFFRNGGEGIAAWLRSSDPGSEPSVCINCPAVSTRPSTWGRLKSLYR